MLVIISRFFLWPTIVNFLLFRPQHRKEWVSLSHNWWSDSPLLLTLRDVDYTGSYYSSPEPPGEDYEGQCWPGKEWVLFSSAAHVTFHVQNARKLWKCPPSARVSLVPGNIQMVWVGYINIIAASARLHPDPSQVKTDDNAKLLSLFTFTSRACWLWVNLWRE